MAKTINLSLQESLLAEVDEVARAESRSRSELFREAAREYVQRRRRWEGIFALGDAARRRRKLAPRDVAREIAAHRKR